LTTLTARSDQTHHDAVEAISSAQQPIQRPSAEILERIKRVRVERDRAEAKLDALVDRAVDLGIGWPEIAAQLGVTRQAARQRHQRRHGSSGGEESLAARIATPVIVGGPAAGAGLTSRS
jgi:protein-disulfide isomerase-like protein with CxxC motif